MEDPTLDADLAAIWSNIEKESNPFIDWSDFWTKDRDDADWVVQDVLARGRGHSIFAKHGTGKSLFTLWAAMEAVKQGNVVVYADYEMTEIDLFERLSDMGYGEETDLTNLRYLMLPDLPPLDTAAGADAFGSVLDDVAFAFPDAHMVVIFDTIGRAVEGAENDNDTIMGFFRHTGMDLKRRGATWLRLDHAGWEGSHARGASSKGDDVDIVWKLVATEDGIELKAEKRRMGWVQDQVSFRKLQEPHLHFLQASTGWPSGTHEVAALLRDLGLDESVSTRAAMKALKDAGTGRRAQVVRSAIRFMKGLDPGEIKTVTKSVTMYPEVGPGPTSDEGPISSGTHSGTHPDPPAESVLIPSDSDGTHSGTHSDPLVLPVGPEIRVPLRDPVGPGSFWDRPDPTLVKMMIEGLRDGSMDPETDMSDDAPRVASAWAEALRGWRV